MTTEEKTKPMTDLFDQAIKNYEQALRTGLKLQEDSGKLWTNLINHTHSPQDWQRKAKSISDDFIPQTQKAMDDGIKLIEQNTRTSVELLKKAVATAQSASVQEAQSRFLGLWEGSLTALRDTTQSVTQANTKAVEAWMEFVRKSAEPAAGHATKA